MDVQAVLAPLGTATLIGVIASVSPCPLTTNIAAISYLSRKLTSPRLVVWGGLAYTLGRGTAYTAIAAIVLLGLRAVPAVSLFVQTYTDKLIGPLLLIVSLFLLGLVRANVNLNVSSASTAKLTDFGLVGDFFLGFVFALAFCPITAALFFGTLIPVALKAGSRVAVPAAFGLGTALPVVVFALIIAFSVKSLARVFNATKTIEKWTRLGTGVLFIIIGTYYCLKYIFHLW